MTQEPIPPARCDMQNYLHDMSLQLAELARDRGLGQAAAYFALAGLALRPAAALGAAPAQADQPFQAASLAR